MGTAKFAILLVFGLLLVFPPRAYAQHRVIVLTRAQNLAMETSQGGVRGSAEDEAVAEIVTAALLRRGYRVVERAVLNAVLREQGFQYSGVVDRTEAVRLGRLTGADAIFMINVYGVSKRYQQAGNTHLPLNSIPLPGLSGFNPEQWMGKTGGTVIEVQMTLKLIDAQSAEILWLLTVA